MPFSWFSEEVANAMADKDPLKKQLGDVAKDLGRHKRQNLHMKKGLLTWPLGLRSLTI